MFASTISVHFESTRSPPPRGEGRFLMNHAQNFQKSSFPYPKMYSDVRKHIPDTPRHPRRVQNTILISKTYFQDEKYDFVLLKLQGKMTNFFRLFFFNCFMSAIGLPGNVFLDPKRLHEKVKLDQKGHAPKSVKFAIVLFFEKIVFSRF